MLYYAVTHAYPGELEKLTMPFEMVLMGSSMARVPCCSCPPSAEARSWPPSAC